MSLHPFDAALREYIENSDHVIAWVGGEPLFGEEAVDAFIGGDHLLDAVDRAAVDRESHAAPEPDGSTRWAIEPTPWCFTGGAHHGADHHAPHAHEGGAHHHVHGDRQCGHACDMPF